MIIIILIIGSIFFLIGATRISKSISLYITIQNTPTFSLETAPQGYVELTGYVLESPSGAQICPLSNTKCAWWSYITERFAGYDKNGKERWFKVAEKSSIQPIFVSDGTNNCYVYPKDAQLYILNTSEWQEQKLNGLYRHYEQFIFPNEDIYILGSLETKKPKQPLKTAEDIILEWKQNPTKIISRFDKDNDGKLNPNEWQLVELAARLEAEDIRNKATTSVLEHYIVKPIGKLPFIISVAGEESLIYELKSSTISNMVMITISVLLFSYVFINSHMS